MNQYELKDGCDKIYGYMISHPQRSEEQTFTKAKADLVANLQAQVARIESITFEQYTKKRSEST